MVVAGGGEERKSLILVSGKFPSKQLVSGLIATLIPSSGNKATYEGVDLISGGDGTAFAFTDEQTLLVGADPLIRTAIDRRKRKPMALQSAAARRGAALLDKSAKWHAYDLCFASSGPTGDSTGCVGQSATGGVLNEGVLKAFDRTYGGLRFTDALEVGVETAAHTEKDAASMVKIMRVLSALSALTKGATSGPLGFLDSLDIRADANIVNFSLKIPRAAFDAMHPAVP
ncbi:MAG: hypothetical protein FJW31_25025 [Acidobacteria bacterium]|nr:hypothetical protein [Acidobacteriota bacterium]